jgi:hypothetical protein
MLAVGVLQPVVASHETSWFTGPRVSAHRCVRFQRKQMNPSPQAAAPFKVATEQEWPRLLASQAGLADPYA